MNKWFKRVNRTLEKKEETRSEKKVPFQFRMCWNRKRVGRRNCKNERRERGGMKEREKKQEGRKKKRKKKRNIKITSSTVTQKRWVEKTLFPISKHHFTSFSSPLLSFFLSLLSLSSQPFHFIILHFFYFPIMFSERERHERRKIEGEKNRTKHHHPSLFSPCFILPFLSLPSLSLLKNMSLLKNILSLPSWLLIPNTSTSDHHHFLCLERETENERISKEERKNRDRERERKKNREEKKEIERKKKEKDDEVVPCW